MPRIELTEELSNALKKARNEKGINAAELAENIDKSVAFISKLENNNAKYVDVDILVKIFRYLLGHDQENFEKYINNLLEKATMTFTHDEIKKQQWIMVFDLEYRNIPIPDSLVEFIKNKLTELNLTPEQIIYELNRNEELTDINIINKKRNSLIFEKNQDVSYIIFDLDINLLTNILNGNIKEINYITMEGIIRALYKLEGLKIKDIANKAVLTLTEHKFYSLSEKRRVVRMKKRDSELETVLTEHDKVNINIVNSILNHIKMLSDWKISYTNEKLKNLDESFKIDPPFILSIVGCEFSKLQNLKTEDKRRFIFDLIALIDKYSKLPIETEQFEEY